LLPFGPEDERVTFYSVFEERAFHVPLPGDVYGKLPSDPSLGWLALMDEAACMTFFNPFIDACIKLLLEDEVDDWWVLHPNGKAGDFKVDQVRDIFFSRDRAIRL
jgi:hypothetical protein